MSELETEDLYGKEVYLVGPEEDEIEDGLLIFLTTESLQEHLLTLTPGIEDVRVLHGILTKCTSIPNNLRDRGVFIIIESPTKLDAGYIVSYDGSDTEELGDIIEDLIKTGGSIQNLMPVNIDEISLLYGYELPLGMAINLEDIDEEIIDTCEEIGKDAGILQQSAG